MKKKKVNKQIIKVKGEDNINIVNSPGTIISNGSGIMDEVISALHKNPLETIDPLSKVKRVLDNHHPYYRFVPNFSREGKPSISIVAKTQDAMEKCPIKGTMSFKLPEKYQHFSSMDDLLRYSYQNQEPIILDEVSRFETFMGDQPLEKVDSSNNSKISIKLLPQSFPEPRPVRISIVKTEHAYNYILLQVIKIDGTVICFSNEKQQDALVTFFLTLDVTTKKGSYDFSFNEGIHITAKKILKKLEFQLAICSGKTIQITDIKMDKVIFEGSSDTNIELCDSIRENLDFYKKIVFIEEKFDIEFDLPDIIEKNDIDQIENLYRIVTNGEVVGQSDEYNLSINQKQGLINIINLARESDNQLSDFIIEFEVQQDLFGSKLNLGMCHFHMPPVRLDKIDELLTLSHFYKDGTEIEVKLVPIFEENNFKQEFLDFVK